MFPALVVAATKWSVPLVTIVTCVAFAMRRTQRAETAVRFSRWTYAIVFPLSLAYFPARAGFRIHCVKCELTFGWRLAVFSLTNYAHIFFFAIFFVLTWAQIPRGKRALAWSAGAAFVMGFLVEIAEGAARIHHCRMRDLIPDMTGALVGAVVIVAATRVIRQRAERG